MDSKRKSALETAIEAMELDVSWETVEDYDKVYKDKSPAYVLRMIVADQAIKSNGKEKSGRGRQNSGDKKTLSPQEYWYFGLQHAAEASKENRYPILDSSFESQHYEVSNENVYLRAWDLMKLHAFSVRSYNINQHEGKASWCRPFFDLQALWNVVKKNGIKDGGQLVKDLYKSGADFVNKAKEPGFGPTDSMRALKDDMMPDFSWNPETKGKKIPKFKEKEYVGIDETDMGPGYVNASAE